ncbi:MAG: UvrD-helicase domain-containing protein [Muribaculaceae bacterium]|nr:UvrD-helicase domain-containing protein [Muribaculaceae bacterium]
MLTIYKASAGSGKTYTLAFEYVRMLLGVKDENGSYRLNLPKYQNGKEIAARHRNILAITFTNKATEEMKSRIVSELSAITADHSDGSKDCPYVPELMREFGCTRDELREVAEKSLRSLLFDYHHFNVSTIDSFFQTVLRAFAREVDRQGDYGVELNDDFAVVSGIGMMLDDLNYGNPPRRKEMMRWISNYTMNLVSDGKDGSMFNRSGSLLKDLARYVGKMGSEVFKQKADMVLEYLEDTDRIKKFIRTIDTREKELMTPLAQRAKEIISTIESFGYAENLLPGAFWRIVRAVIDGDEMEIKDFRQTKTGKMLSWRTSGDNSFYTKKYCPKGQLPPDSLSDELCDWMNDAYRAAAEIYALDKIKSACPNLEFLGFTWHYINRFREENNLILLSDTHDLLQRIIGGSETPFIYERIGVMLRHFLIDEFQDTSHMQWQNLKPLVADSLSTGCDNLIIGDEKQAIYRFRNSDSSLLHHVVAQEDFPKDHVIRGNCAAENTNHRSAPGIVRFNNALFTRIARNCGVAGYENTVQSVFDRKAALQSYIKIYDTSELDMVNDMPAEFDITAREILRQHEAGYRWKDIAVLVRKRAEAEAVVNYLLEYYPEIKVLSDEALLLKNSPAVKLVISMLKLVDESYSAMTDNGGTDRSGAPVYGTVGDIRMMISRYEYFIAEGYGTEEALSLALEPSGAAEEMSIAGSIVDIREAHPAGLVSLVETIIAKKVPPSRRRKEYAYLAAFQDEVINYCTLYNPSVHAFLDWWADASQHLAINSGAGQDAVSVMTVHKSKGLQWACVHVPFGDWKLVRPSESVWIAPDFLDFVEPDICPPLISVELNEKCMLEGSPLKSQAELSRHEQLVDNLNATYVAYTRPERELTICFAKHVAAGKEVFDALGQSPDDGELCMDLATHVREDINEEPAGLLFVYGEPTAPEHKSDDNIEPDDEELRDYRVFFREDTAALTSIDDATADVGEIISDINGDEDNALSETPEYEKLRAIAAERGTHLHSIMADIETADDIEQVIDRAALRYGLTEANADEYRKIIRNAFDSAGRNVVRWFSPTARIFKEQSIYKPEGDSTYRPDRIVIGEDGAVEVVDYKFTTEPLASHQRQVEVYVSLLKVMGYENVTGYLWYPELNIIKSVK